MPSTSPTIGANKNYLKPTLTNPSSPKPVGTISPKISGKKEAMIKKDPLKPTRIPSNKVIGKGQINLSSDKKDQKNE